MDEFLLWANARGVWQIANLLVVFLSAIIGFGLIFWSKRRVKHLNFFLKGHRDSSNYPHKLYLEIRNYTGRSVVISSPFYKYIGLRADPNARGDSPSEEFEIKFAHPKEDQLTEVEYLIRNKESVSTWIPIDPTHKDTEVEKAIHDHRTVKFSCVCTWLEEKPRVHKLSRAL